MNFDNCVTEYIDIAAGTPAPPPNVPMIDVLMELGRRMRNAALEEAAVRCDQHSDDAGYSDDHSIEAHRADDRARALASAIRAMKDETPHDFVWKRLQL